LQPRIEFALGNIDLRIGAGISHQAGKTPAIKIATSHDGPFADADCSYIQVMTALTETFRRLPVDLSRHRLSPGCQENGLDDPLVARSCAPQLMRG